jgi:ABC-type transporter Mla subunit MlaD
LSVGLKYHRQLDQRLAELSEDITTGISLDAIAGCINESLHQQFASSTLPETAKALAYVARNMRTTAAEFVRTASSVANAYRGSADAAGRAISDLESAISRAAASARRAADDLTVTFHRTYRWALCTIAGLGLFAGILFGMLLLGYLRP